MRSTTPPQNSGRYLVAGLLIFIRPLYYLFMFGFFSNQDFPIVPFVLAAVIFTGLSGLFSGCYTVKQGTTMLSYLGRAIPLEELADRGSPNKADENRRFAERVADIRRFAMEELGLKESKNYTRYVEIDRNYLAAVVYASAKDSFTRYEWWFPIVGKVPYKGFFNPDDARRERLKLERKGLDVWVRGVDAFSTLGWFQDPLYSYMKQYPVQELADVLIHELFHATVYLKSHSQFNESLAEFVGNEGARLYMEKLRLVSESKAADLNRTEPDTAEFIPLELGPTEFTTNNLYNETVRADNIVFIAYISGLIAELSAVYENPAFSSQEKLRLKAEIIAASQAHFEEVYDETFQTNIYRDFSSLPVNNAYLDLYRLYHEEDTWFADAYKNSGSDLRAYIAAAKTLTGKGDPYAEFEEALDIK